MAALLVGLIVTAVLSWTAYVLNDHNEDRLLKLQTAEAGAVLQVVVPVIETPLSSAAQIAETTHAARSPFASYIAPFIGPTAPFVSVSLWQLSGGTAKMLYAQGSAPELAKQPDVAARFLGVAAQRPMLQVTGPLGSSPNELRIGYAFATSAGPVTFVVYAEGRLPPGRRAPPSTSTAFSDLRFALYLGAKRTPDTLVETNTDRVPITGRTSAISVPFGGSSLMLVTAPSKPLGGELSAAIWWIVAIAGVLLSAGAAVMAERLTRRSLAAERLAGEVQHLLSEQRSIAGTLQRALLPDAVPAAHDIEFAVRYVPGEDGVDIGGDWYDVIPLGGQRFFFVVGDVSGRGIPAGTTMASLRFAIRGFVSEGHGPAAVLDRVARMLRDGDGERFATALCGVIDVPGHELTVANAGHLPPLVIAADDAWYSDGPIDPPLGVAGRESYRTGAVSVPPGATLLAYTDGLVERRGEGLDVGLERLQQAARATDRAAALDDVVASIVAEVGPATQDDDIAVLAVRWAR